MLTLQAYTQCGRSPGHLLFKIHCQPLTTDTETLIRNDMTHSLIKFCSSKFTLEPEQGQNCLFTRG